MDHTTRIKSGRQPPNDRSFLFVGSNDTPSAVKPTERHKARSHASKQGRLTHRKQREQRLENFNVMTLRSFKKPTRELELESVHQRPVDLAIRRSTDTSEHEEAWGSSNRGSEGSSHEDLHRHERRLSPLVADRALFEVDPFGSLPVPATQLLTLMSTANARSAGEPIFCVIPEDPLRSLSTVFRGQGLLDHAVCTGIALHLKFAWSGWQMTYECTKYMREVVQTVNTNITNLHEANAEAVVGAILLLAAVELRLENQVEAEWHRQGANQILKAHPMLSKTLHPSIQRGLFWQDLFTSMLMGNKRLFHPESFPGLFSIPESVLRPDRRLPRGFESARHILSAELLAILEDLHLLTTELCQESNQAGVLSKSKKLELDSQQAWIETRLLDVQDQTLGLGLIPDCILKATFICTYTLDISTWGSYFIPTQLSKQMLITLRKTTSSSFWIAHQDLLFWLVFVGCYVADVAIKQQYRNFYRDVASIHALSNVFQGYELEISQAFMWPKETTIDQIAETYDSLTRIPDMATFETEEATERQQTDVHPR